MIVVSDSSPIILLAKIDCLFILPKLYGAIVIPLEVAEELRHEQPKHPGCVIIGGHPWLQTKTCSQPIIAPGFDWGESAALGLAQELHATLLQSASGANDSP